MNRLSVAEVSAQTKVLTIDPSPFRRSPLVLEASHSSVGEYGPHPVIHAVVATQDRNLVSFIIMLASTIVERLLRFETRLERWPKKSDRVPWMPKPWLISALEGMVVSYRLDCTQANKTCSSSSSTLRSPTPVRSPNSPFLFLASAPCSLRLLYLPALLMRTSDRI